MWSNLGHARFRIAQDLKPLWADQLPQAMKWGLAKSGLP
jgi:hypothetical protein